jgi:hypothetical protein
VLRFSGYKYYLVLLDDFTHYVWTFPVRLKSEVLPIIRSFHAYVYTQFRLPVVALQMEARLPLLSRHCISSFLSIHLTTKWESETNPSFS